MTRAEREGPMDSPRTPEHDPWKVAGDHPESRCQRCGGPNVWSWAAPNPLWNAVMRDPETGRDTYGIVCPPCFSELTALKGIGGGTIDGLPRWHWRFSPEVPDGEIAALWTDSGGRQWNPETWLWEEQTDG